MQVRLYYCKFLFWTQKMMFIIDGIVYKCTIKYKVDVIYFLMLRFLLFVFFAKYWSSGHWNVCITQLQLFLSMLIHNLLYCFLENIFKVWLFFADSINATEIGFHNFVISEPFKVMGCLINKVASSSLVLAFLSLKGINTNGIVSPHSRLGLIQPKVIIQKNKPGLGVNFMNPKCWRLTYKIGF